MVWLDQARGFMRSRRSTVVALCLVVAACVAAGCGSSGSGSDSTSSASAAPAASTPAASTGTTSSSEQSCGGSGTTLAVSWPNLSVTPAVLALLHRAQAAGKELGWKVLLDDPGTDLNKQVNTVKTWTQQKVSAIMTVTLSAGVFENLAKQARSAGIKWINYGSSLKNEDTMIGYDQHGDGFKLGQSAGKWITEHLNGKAKVALLTYEPGEWSRGRISGVEDGLKQSAPDAEIVARHDALSEAEGLSATRTILQAHKDLNVVLGVNDAAAEGAYKAWTAAGKAKDDPQGFIGGIDGDVLALQLVKAGNTVYRTSVAIPLLKVGDAIVDVTKRLLCGDKVAQWISPTQLIEAGAPDGSKLAAQFLTDQGAK